MISGGLPCTGLLLDNGLIATLSPLPEAIANPPASSPTKLRSTNAHLRQDQDRQVQYEETMIDHKRYLYDSPRANIERKRKTEPWETYSYQHNESPEAGGCAMASGE
jgi:hypothetical protein